MIDFGFGGPVTPAQPDISVEVAQAAGLDFGPLDDAMERARWARLGLTGEALDYVARLYGWAVHPDPAASLDKRLDGALRYLSCVYRNTPLHPAIEVAHERVYARLHPRTTVTAEDFGF